MPRHFRAAWPALVLLALPQFAFSGPIEWSYHTEANYAQLRFAVPDHSCARWRRAHAPRRFQVLGLAL